MFGLGQKVVLRLAWSKFWPILAIKGPLTGFHGNEAKKLFLKKKIKIADSKKKKKKIFKTNNSPYFFVKSSWIGSWISSIDWCEGHLCGLTYMAVRLCNISSKMTYKHKKCFLADFPAYIGQPHGHILRLSHINALSINQSY